MQSFFVTNTFREKVNMFKRKKEEKNIERKTPVVYFQKKKNIYIYKSTISYIFYNIQ